MESDVCMGKGGPEVRSGRVVARGQGRGVYPSQVVSGSCRWLLLQTVISCFRNTEIFNVLSSWRRVMDIVLLKHQCAQESLGGEEAVKMQILTQLSWARSETAFLMTS